MLLIAIAAASLGLSGSTFVEQPVRMPMTGQIGYRTSVAVIFVGEDYPGQAAFQNSANRLRLSFKQWEFPKQNILVIPARQQKDVEATLGKVGAFTTNKDRVLITFVCHGVSTQSGPLLRLRLDGKGDVAMQDAIGWVRAVPAHHKLLILDACKSGDVRGLEPPRGMANTPEAMAADSYAVLLTSAPNQGAIVGKSSTQFVDAFLLSVGEVRKNAAKRIRGTHLGEVFAETQERLPEVTLGAPIGGSTQCLLNPKPTEFGDDYQFETVQYDENDISSVNAAIRELRNRHDAENDPVVRDELGLQLGVALMNQFEPEFRGRDLQGATDLLSGLRHVRPEHELDRRFSLAQAFYALSQVRDMRLNLKRAVDEYLRCTRSEQPLSLSWAAACNNLGNAYLGWAKIENPAQHLNSALDALDKALTVRTKASSPLDWARTKSNVGIAYSSFARVAEPTYNLELAFEAYKEALTIEGKVSSPVDWAVTRNNMGNAYSDYSRLSHPLDNVKSAIQCYQDALDVFKEQSHPLAWAMTKNNLGAAYRELAKRENPKKNLGFAITCHEDTLRIYTEKFLPQLWGTSKNNLGNAHRDLAKLENPSQNLQTAIADCDDALRVFSEAKLPQDYASTKNNLGLAYSDYADVERPATNLSSANDAFEDALRIYDRTHYRRSWAMIRTNMGLVYAKRAKLEHAVVNQQEAIDAYKDALSEYASNSPEWAQVEVNLGISYYELSNQIDKKKNLRLALECFRGAEPIFRGAGLKGHADQIKGVADQIATEIANLKP